MAAVYRQSSFPFVLSGGTALARFYFQHRVSEDLDFFFEGFDFEIDIVEKTVNALRRKGLICKQTGVTDRPGLLKAVSYLFSMERELKVDFLEDPFSGMWTPVKKKIAQDVEISVDHIEQIYYRKLYAVIHAGKSSRSQRVKDLVDLYYLHLRHRPVVEFLKYIAQENIALPEGEIAYCLDRVDRDQFLQGIEMMDIEVDGDIIYQAIREISATIFEEGLG